MNTNEIEAWIKSAILVASEKKCDESGNDSAWRVYEKDGRLYRIWFFNGEPQKKWIRVGVTSQWSPDECVNPELVERKIIETVTYEPV